MYSLVSTRNAAPTAYELERLRKSERTAILNNLIFESADMLADFAFILVLFDQSVSINLPPTWYTLAFECSVSTPTTAQLQPVREEIFQVAIAATVFFVFNALYRAGSAVFQIFANSDRIQGVLGWFMCLVGVGATVVDPWSGSVIIEHQLAPSYRDQELDDYRMTLKELRSNWTLLVLEDVPQFILQIIYAVIIARSEYVGLSPACIGGYFGTHQAHGWTSGKQP
ncbi:hypothetical protein BASA81_000712 [Batrachochytrium salamandrivorans]|nr:hypothetical protein BASA81_000712 [Batrachochytrium salamandrivorans]